MRTTLLSAGAVLCLTVVWCTQAHAQQSDAFVAGAADRSAFEAWFGSLDGDYRAGADYWAAHRSIPKEAFCRGNAQQIEGCMAAKQRLSPFDARRKSEPDYRLGWNSVQTSPPPVPASSSVTPLGVEPLYHVQHDTYGCVKPRATVAITNQADPRRSDPGWVRYVINDGQCAPITPKSPWRLIRREGDLALMTYAGTTGLPGTFYLKAADLVDPGPKSDFNPPLPTDPSPPMAGTAPVVTAETNAPPPPSHTDSPIKGYYNPPPSDAQPRTQPTVLAPPPMATPPWQPAPQASSEVSSAILLVMFGVVAAVIAFLILKSRAEHARFKAAEQRQQRALRVAISEIDAKAHLLYVRREQLTQPDYYGTVDPKPWENEKLRFVESRVVPLMNEGGFSDIVVEILPQIFSAIDEAAWRPIDPAKRATFSNPDTFSPDMDPVHYEMHCALQLQKGGWITRSTPRTGDQGADILAEKNGLTLTVQCKLYSNSVGNSAVQEAVAARVYHRTALAAVVSNAPFTRSARELAGMSGVTLLHHSQLPAYTGRGGPTEVMEEAS